MNLSTTYLGIKLAHPIVPGASPLTHDLDHAMKLAEHGAPLIHMHSLFEEQITHEQVDSHRVMTAFDGSFAEAASFFPDSDVFALGPDEYLEQIRKIRERTNLPVVASLNGATLGGWLDYARSMEQAGASAIELNLYVLATDPNDEAEQIERRLLWIVREVRSTVKIPIAVKLSPFFSALPAFARRIEEAGANGLVLFNRFYQPDIDVEDLSVLRTLHLSTPEELLLRLRWLAILSPKVRGSLAASGGVHSGLDAVKAVMTGAHAVQVVSALLKEGPARLATLVHEMREWMTAHDYTSLDEMRGSMSLERCPNPLGYERANYVTILQSWR